MSINHDQAIFDAIAAATDHNDDGIFVDVQKFINTFNGHRDRKLCTSLDVAQQPPVYEAMEAALEIGKPGVERMVAAVAQTPKCARCGSSGDTYVLCSGCGAPAQAPPDQFMDDYKRDTTNAMAARILELEALLSAAQAPSDDTVKTALRLARDYLLEEAESGSVWSTRRNAAAVAAIEAAMLAFVRTAPSGRST